MAARLNPEIHHRWENQGIQMISPEEGLHLLEKLLDQDLPQFAVLPIDWATFRRHLENPTAYSLIADLMHSEPGTPKTASQDLTPKIRQQLENLSLKEKMQSLQTHVKEQVVAVLSMKPDQHLNVRQGFTEMGMDSLMAVRIEPAPTKKPE